MNPDRIYLDYIQQAIASVERFTVDGRAAFEESELIQAAVFYKLQTLAESTQRLSEALRDSVSDVDWDAIRGFRNRLVHEYLNLNLALVWEIIEYEIPRLKQAAALLLQTLDNE